MSSFRAENHLVIQIKPIQIIKWNKFLSMGVPILTLYKGFSFTPLCAWPSTYRFSFFMHNLYNLKLISQYCYYVPWEQLCLMRYLLAPSHTIIFLLIQEFYQTQIWIEFLQNLLHLMVHTANFPSRHEILSGRNEVP